MSEAFKPEDFPYLQSLRQERQKAGLERLDVALLSAQSGSQDPVLAERAQYLLRKNWELDPNRSAERAPTVDLMEQFERFSEQEKRLMLANAVGIQLTEGCNGNCPFCLFGKKKGVEAKYSFESISAFLKTYGRFLPESPVLYWDSDPFDYRDGDKNFTDVYKAWRELRPAEYHYISTAIPRGSEEDFIDFMRFAAVRFRDTLYRNDLQVRISLAKHNVQRVEAVFERLIAVLREDGFLPSGINYFLKNYVETGKRFFDDPGSTKWKLGSLIEGHDDIKDIPTPACNDGVLITPRALKAIMVTAPTIYEPSGEKDTVIVPGQAARQTPARRSIPASFGNLIPPLHTAYGKEYGLDNPADDVVLRLGREAFAYGRAIEEFAGHGSASIQGNDFTRRKAQNEQLIKRAQALISNGDLEPSESERIKFYILLDKTRFAELDFLAQQTKHGQTLETIRAIAAIFLHVGREQVARLPQIIGELLEIQGEVKKRGISQTNFAALRNKLTANLSQYFGLKGDSPAWFQEAMVSYCDSLKGGGERLKKPLPPLGKFFGRFSILK